MGKWANGKKVANGEGGCTYGDGQFSYLLEGKYLSIKILEMKLFKKAN